MGPARAATAGHKQAGQIARLITARFKCPLDESVLLGRGRARIGKPCHRRRIAKDGGEERQLVIPLIQAVLSTGQLKDRFRVSAGGRLIPYGHP
jgi:hypothetical protein